MSRILLTTNIPDEKTAATKARVDVKEILEDEGYQTLQVPVKMNLFNTFRFYRQLSKIARRGSHVVLEYPLKIRRRLYPIALVCRLKGIRLYGIIHDIGALREQKSPKIDLSVLKLFDGLVSHNFSMTAWLRKNGFRKPVVDLGVFDYLLDNPRSFSEAGMNGTVRVFYAGNLNPNKAAFIYDDKMDKLGKVELNIYGQAFEPSQVKAARINYKGLFNPGNPDLAENYHFGLIWEGKSLETCDGELGEYIRYNNPHKFSLYLALGLPVIVWKEAAIARFVTDNNIGVTISSLRELEELDRGQVAASYQMYIKNIGALADKVRKGYFLRVALEKLVKS